MLDWPGKVTATVFLAGCPLRCPYCHNPELIGSSSHTEGTDALFAHIRDRRAWLDGVVITGGEPTAHQHIVTLVRAIRAEGMPVKLDTNGTHPDVLRGLLAEGLVDYVAMDVKATPERYELATGGSDVWAQVSASIKTIIASGVDHEFRTTCYPIAVGPEDIAHIAAHLVGARRYVLQQFRARRTLDPAAASVRPHQAETLKRAADRCSMFVSTFVRGVS